jgi:hypothetical protein
VQSLFFFFLAKGSNTETHTIPYKVVSISCRRRRRDRPAGPSFLSLRHLGHHPCFCQPFRVQPNGGKSEEMDEKWGKRIFPKMGERRAINNARRV